MGVITANLIQYWVVLLIIFLETVILHPHFWEILSYVSEWLLSLDPTSESARLVFPWWVLTALTKLFKISGWCFKSMSQEELENFVKGNSSYSSYLFSFSTDDSLKCTVYGSQSVSWEITTLLQTCISSWVGHLELNPQFLPSMPIGMNNSSYISIPISL